jgi:hypothetical protein
MPVASLCLDRLAYRAAVREIQMQFVKVMGFASLYPSYSLPDGQISKMLSSPSRKNISLNTSGKSKL